jgi:glycosyltransferase involved in cell wall biosynthesis
MSTRVPLVSVVTPVFNGDRYLAECIESVLAQTYSNWEYVIVNNCSTDKTHEIAEEYAKRDRRIRLVNSREFVGAIENHHRAFRLISADSVYCKVVSADDWITPECLRKMIDVAQAHPTVGIVGAYQLCDDVVKWKGLPVDVEFLSGREVGRLELLQQISVLGNPTANLFRADLVRQDRPFFPHSRPHADVSASFEQLQYCDFGFVHDVLSVERIHAHQVSARVRDLSMLELGVLECVLQYGPIYLGDEEFKTLRTGSFEGYYRHLGGSLLKLKSRAFWDYHVRGLKTIGYPISWTKVMRCAAIEALEEIRHPSVAGRKVLAALRSVAVRSR